jgi:hypothetical protein
MKIVDYVWVGHTQKEAGEKFGIPRPNVVKMMEES